MHINGGGAASRQQQQLAHVDLEDPERTMTQLPVVQGTAAADHSHWMEHMAPNSVVVEEHNMSGGLA
jgi:hypothetical protein